MQNEDHSQPVSDEAFDALIQQHIDSKTKPVGSLGRVEELGAQIARVQRSLTPVMERCELVIFAGDHGLVEEGVSAYPQVVTREMVFNFLRGGAASNVFAASVGARFSVVDAGVAGEPIDDPKLVSRSVGAGTRNSAREPAMTIGERDRAVSLGMPFGADSNADALCFGEMGIGNTSAATLLTHKITGRPLEELTGKGTGLDAAGVSRKLEILTRASTRTDAILSAEDALAEYGGYEIAMMVGAMLGAAASGKIVIVDGFIACAAALVATEINSEARHAMVFAHKSEERGAAALLEALDAKPLLDLDMRLGEGTGALLAWPLVKAGAAMMRDMASFDSAGVSGPA